MIFKFIIAWIHIQMMIGTVRTYFTQYLYRIKHHFVS